MSVDRLGNGEISLAITPLLLLLVAVAAIVAIAGLRPESTRLRAQLCLAGALTVCVSIVLPMKLSVGSLWRVPWTLMPGASGIRAIDRLQILVGPVACLTVAIGTAVLAPTLATLRSPRRARSPRIAVAAVVVLAAVEQVNVSDNTAIDRSDEVKMQLDAPYPPSGCDVFFIVDSSVPPQLGVDLSGLSEPGASMGGCQPRRDGPVFV